MTGLTRSGTPADCQNPTTSAFIHKALTLPTMDDLWAQLTGWAIFDHLWKCLLCVGTDIMHG